MTHNEIVARMNYVKNRRGLTIKDLVKKTGLSYRTVQTILSGNHGNSYSFQVIMEALGLEVNVI